MAIESTETSVENELEIWCDSSGGLNLEGNRIDYEKLELRDGWKIGDMWQNVYGVEQTLCSLSAARFFWIKCSGICVESVSNKHYVIFLQQYFLDKMLWDSYILESLDLILAWISNG